MNTHTHTYIYTFIGPLSGTARVSRYQKGKTNLDFTEARDSEWQWHQLGHMQVWTLLQTDNHTSTPPLCFLQAGCPSCRPTNSVKAPKTEKNVKNERLQKTQTVRQDVQKLILVWKSKLCCTTHTQDNLINLSTENATSATNAAQCFLALWQTLHQAEFCRTRHTARLG